LKSVAKQLHFPVAGVSRHLSFRDSTAPSEVSKYSAPFAVNVRGRCTFGDRLRGGSRPGLAALPGVTTTENGHWLWPNGEPILWPDGANMAFADKRTTVSGATMLQQHAAFSVAASRGDAPTSPTAVAFYRARAVAAKGALWYASRTGDATDWDYGDDRDDVSRAAAGNLALATMRGEDITALMAIDDKWLFAATAHALWMFQGEVTAGISLVSDNIGCVGKDAWCWTGSMLVTLSNRGLYGIVPGGAVTALSDKMPDEFNGITASDDPLLVYDPAENAVHIFSDKGNWFLDLEERALWPVVFADDDYCPVAGCRAMVDGEFVCAFLCADDEWRRFDENADKDGMIFAEGVLTDGDEFTSAVAIGPFHVAANDSMDGMLDDIYATFGEGSGDCRVEIAVARSAEKAAERARSGTFATGFDAPGGWNRIVHARSRGAWAVIVVTSTERWAYEAMHVKCKQLGRLR